MTIGKAIGRCVENTIIGILLSFVVAVGIDNIIMI